ncbi:hypothetical protein HZS_8133, partial [Henneguya salminicola]
PFLKNHPSRDTTPRGNAEQINRMRATAQKIQSINLQTISEISTENKIPSGKTKKLEFNFTTFFDCSSSFLSYMVCQEALQLYLLYVNIHQCGVKYLFILTTLKTCAVIKILKLH